MARAKRYNPYRGKGPSGRGGRALRALLALVLAVVLVFSVLFGIVLAGKRDQIKGECGIMIILGCQVLPSGPSVLLQDRLDEALVWLEEHPDTVVVTAGGKGDDEHVSEARAMADYLIAHGYPEEQILLEDDSHNTDENLRYTMSLLAREGYDVTQNMIVVSSGFHLARVRMLWGRVCGTTGNLSTLAAPATHLPSAVYMHLREPLALLKSFLFDRGV